MRWIVVFCALWVFLSCKEKKDNHFRGHSIKVTPAMRQKVPQDSIEPPVEYPGSKTKVTSLSFGKPLSVFPERNVFVAGRPITTKLGSPRVLIPGRESCEQPRVSVLDDSVFLAGEPEMREAKEMARKERNPLSIGYFAKPEGLTQDVVNCVTQDHLGNIWIGTNNGGATRYDGKDFFHYSSLTGLVHDDVLSILEDKRGNIWFGTSGGVSRFDGKYFSSYKWPKETSVNCLAEDNTGKVWLGTSSGAFCFDGKVFTGYSTREGLSGNSVYSIYVDRAGVIWFGTLDGGVTKFDGSSFVHLTTSEGLSSDRILSIHEDTDGNLWFGTAGGGAIKFDGENLYNYTAEHGLIDNVIGWIEVDLHGHIWFGTQKGPCSYDGEVFTHYNETLGMSNQIVYGIFSDQSGNIWVATAGGGLCRIDGIKFRHYSKFDGLCNSAIQSILMNSGSPLWLGSEDGLIQFDGNTFTNYPSLPNSALRMFIHDMLNDNRGRRWLALDNANIIVEDGGEFKQIILSEDLNSLSISCALQDRAGHIWLGTFGDGVIRFDGVNYYRYTVKNGLSHNHVKCILEDSSGKLWFGSDGGGVTILDGREFYHFEGLEGKDDFVYCMLEDSEKNIWMGTLGNGLLRYDGKSFAHLTSHEGLSNDNIFALHEEIMPSGSSIWIGTRQGLSKLSLKKFDSLIQSGGRLSEDEVLFESFDPRDGFLGIGCNLGAMNQSNDGSVWIGANNMLTQLHSRYVVSDSLPPRIVISALEPFNEKISWSDLFSRTDSSYELANGVIFDDFSMDSVSRWFNLPQGLSLNHDNNSITFRYAGITMHQPWKVKYRYKLEGFDEDWSALTSSSAAQYGNLPAGIYTFKVKAMGSGGAWSEPCEYSFTILPPWWRNWWSYGLYLLLGLLAIVMIFRWRMRSLRSQQKRLESKIEQATQVILDQKNEVERQKDFAEAQRMEAEEQRRIAQQQKLLVEDQNKEILDSIEYAKRIQTAILPPSKTVKELLRDSFVLYLPKDIVAGDFYWVDALGDDIYFAACDCTGHGVPGAMVSVICNYVLHASVNEFALRTPGEIFDKSRELLVENFAKSEEDVKDGMDASMCALNFKTKKLQWSGANNPLWIYRSADHVIEEYKPDKQPIGKGYELTPFTTLEMDLQTGDIIYVFTDGYADQFGGERNKKLTRARFRELLLSLARLPLEEQRSQLLAFHHQYRGAQEQVDDICIIAVRV